MSATTTHVQWHGRFALCLTIHTTHGVWLQVLGSELSRSVDLAGNVTVEMATKAAEAFKTAQNALDQALPGPSLEMVIGNLRCVL